MLSYRHSFHAGNFADLLKHIVLVEILEHLIQKDAAFEYIDTHAGAGLYNLGAAETQKLREYMTGIGQLAVKDFPELARYFAVVRAFNRSERLDFYPGSPLIAHYFLRPQDRAWLYELHPQDYELLRGNVAKHRNIRVQHQDGFDGLKALLPPTSRRGLVLIDPSYEIKTDYDRVVQQVIKAYKKFSQGIYAIWYPVVDRKTVQKLEKTLIDSGIRNIQRFELGVSPDTEQRGMTSSGMIVINPPWKLYDKLSQLLPRLAQQISQSDDQFFKCDYLVAE